MDPCANRNHRKPLCRWQSLAVLLVSLFAGAATATEDELLPPNEAFAMTARVDGSTALVSWRVAPGYFMYRDKFRFIVDGQKIEAASARIPRGERKVDELFGDVEVLRGSFTIELALSPAASLAVELRATSQGCADIGVCYPPQTTTVSLPIAADAFTPSTDKLALTELSSLFGSAETSEFLPPDLAFVLRTTVNADGAIVAKWDIADGYYLYRHKLKAAVIKPADVTVARIEIAPGQRRTDEYFGEVEVFYDRTQARVVLDRVQAVPNQVELELSYQGCADAGLCYPPQKRRFSFDLPALDGLIMRSAGADTGAAAVADAELSQQDRIAKSLTGDNLAWSLLAFFGFGLLLTFTPCVLPMIPILSSIIIGQGDNLSTRRAFTLSLVYVLAMAFTYAIVGAAAGLLGGGLQAAFQDPVVIVSFCLVFVALAGAMFGLYELALPARWQTALSGVSNEQTAGSYAGVAIMGVLSAVIVGPCVAAPLAGALIYIGQTGDALLGGAALFTLSLGMGVPLLIVGSSAGRWLPKAGVWMDKIKALFGFVLLGVGIYLLERVVPAWLPMILWAALLIGFAVYHDLFRGLPTPSSRLQRCAKAVAVVPALYGILLVIGVAGGSTDPLRPLEAFAGAPAHQSLAFKRVGSSVALGQEIAQAGNDGRAIMLDYYADWCVSCKEMEKLTFSDTAVQSVLSDVTLLQIDVTSNTDEDQALLKRFGLYGPPAILFFDANGVENARFRLVGFIAAEPFAEHVRKALF